MSLVVVTVIAGLSLSMLRFSLRYNKEHGSTVDEERSMALAESGVSEALFALRHGGTGEIGSRANPGVQGDGLVWVEMQNLGDEHVELTATGMAGAGRSAIQLVVDVDGLGYQWNSAVFSLDDLEILSSTFLDSFESAAGSYASQVSGGIAKKGGDVGSNKDIRIQSSATVWGDGHPGPGGTVYGANSIEGSILPNLELMELAPVEMPKFPASLGPLNVPNKKNATLPTGRYRLDSLTIGTGASATIEGPAQVYVDAIELRSSSSLTFDTTNGPVHVFVAGAFHQNSNSTFTSVPATNNDAAINFVGDETQSIVFDSNGEFHGTVYSPRGTVEIRSNFEIFGALAARKVVLAANTTLHYDESIIEEVDPAPPNPLVESWARVQFPHDDLLKNRHDPYKLLKIDPKYGQSPAELWVMADEDWDKQDGPFSDLGNVTDSGVISVTSGGGGPMGGGPK